MVGQYCVTFYKHHKKLPKVVYFRHCKIFFSFEGSGGGHLSEDWQDSKGEGDYTPHSGGDWGPPGQHLPGGGGSGLEEGGLRDPLLLEQQGFKSPGFDNSNQSGNLLQVFTNEK